MHVVFLIEEGGCERVKCMIHEVALCKRDGFADSQWVFHRISVLLLSMTDSEYNQELSEDIKQYNLRQD